MDKTLEERGARYGEFAEHARIAQGIQDVMRANPNWHTMDHDMKQALTVIADKIARILNGDPFYADNWHDIQGYAKLVETRINGIPQKENELFDNEVEIARKKQEQEELERAAIKLNIATRNQAEREAVKERTEKEIQKLLGIVGGTGPHRFYPKGFA